MSQFIILCSIENLTKRKSHIFPKFTTIKLLITSLCKALVLPKISLRMQVCGCLRRNMLRTPFYKIQHTPKCVLCETLFATYISHAVSKRIYQERLILKFLWGKPRRAKSSVTLQRKPQFSSTFSYFLRFFPVWHR